MKKALSALFILLVVSLTAQEKKKVFGKVSDGNNPIENVKITNVDKDVSSTTSADGTYEIMVAEGDKLQFSHTGLKTINIKIEDVTRVLSPIMIPDVTELDEVVVTKNRREPQSKLLKNYATDKRIVRTINGFMNTDWAVGFVRVIGKGEFSPADNCVLDLLKNRSAEVSVVGSCFGPMIKNNDALSASVGYVYINSNSFAAYGPAVYDVDGQLYVSTPFFLDITTIERLAILDDKAARIMYGGGGITSGGVIVINTIDGLKKSPGSYDYARLKDNFVTGKVLTEAEVEKNVPTYLKELSASTSLKDAKLVFEKYDNQYSSSPYFYLDAYTHFYEERNDESFADEIIEANFKSFRNNAVLLKALAYTYENQNRYNKANEVYKEAFILRPNYAQSYLDMANSYRNLNENKQAASMYARYEYLLNEGFMEVDTVGFGPIIYREFNNLLMLNKDAVVKGRKAKTLFVAEEEFEGTRLVFEWNDSEAEFELQFVNPGNQYHTWKHSLADNSEVITLEKEFGYNVTEYLIDGSLPGIWKVNVNYLGNKSLSPTYLKATIYQNYGSKTQSKEVKVFKLMLKNVNQQLFKLNISSIVN